MNQGSCQAGLTAAYITSRRRASVRRNEADLVDRPERIVAAVREDEAEVVRAGDRRPGGGQRRDCGIRNSLVERNRRERRAVAAVELDEEIALRGGWGRARHDAGDVVRQLEVVRDLADVDR